MSTPDQQPRSLTAKDSPRRVFWYFCAACWMAWMLVAALTVWALYMVNAQAVPFERAQVLAGFWWITYFCLGLTGAVRLLIGWVERRA